MKKIFASIFFILFSVCLYAETLSISNLLDEDKAIPYLLNNDWNVEKTSDNIYVAKKENVSFLWHDISKIRIVYKESGILNSILVTYKDMPVLESYELLGNYLYSFEPKLVNASKGESWIEYNYEYIDKLTEYTMNTTFVIFDNYGMIHMQVRFDF